MTTVSAQRTAARASGLLYVLIMALSLFTELYARGPLLVQGDAEQTARNIVASERLFRVAAVSQVIIAAGDVALLLALYVVLAPINRNLAWLAAFWQLTQCAMFTLIAFTDFAALSLLNGGDYLRAFKADELHALARFFIGLHHPGGQIGGVFFGLGSAVFAWLWLQSRYVPPILSALGVFGAFAVTTGTVAILIFPALAAPLSPAYWLPIFLFEVILGFWLLFKGMRRDHATNQ
jgi:hypothetical protein